MMQDFGIKYSTAKAGKRNGVQNRKCNFQCPGGDDEITVQQFKYIRYTPVNFVTRQVDLDVQLVQVSPPRPGAVTESPA